MTTHISTGISRGNDGFDAGQKAAHYAKESFKGDRIDLAIVFSSLKYHLDEVNKGIQDVIGVVPMVGASSCGEFTGKNAFEQSVAVALIQSDTHRFHIASVSGIKANSYEKVQECVDSLPKAVEGYPFRSAMVLHDGLVGKGQRIVDLIAWKLGPDVSLAGGAAGDELRFKETFVMHNGKVMSDALVIVHIASKRRVGLGVMHGHVPASPELEVTKADGCVLCRVNGKPAFDVWKDQLRGKADGIDVDALKTNQEIGAFLLKYEMGIRLAGDKYKVRIPLSVNPDGSMNFAVDMYEGARFQIMSSVKEKQIESARIAAQKAKEDVHGSKIAGALIFDCVCRGLILKEQFADAVKAMADVLDDAPLAGFETYGEICMKDGDSFSGFHNTTTVVMVFPD